MSTNSLHSISKFNHKNQTRTNTNKKRNKTSTKYISSHQRSYQILNIKQNINTVYIKTRTCEACSTIKHILWSDNNQTCLCRPNRNVRPGTSGLAMVLKEIYFAYSTRFLFRK